MNKKVFISCLLSLLLCLKIHAQELYPLSEPASSIPVNTIGIKVLSETYHEVNQWRNVSLLRLMYGATPKLSVYLSFLMSNHHGEKLPEQFPFHNTPERGAYYPYIFNGAHLYLKYRFLTLDKQKEHLRMAAYAEAAMVNTTHHEAEPNLMMGDNSGVGGGLITTYLKNKLAVSITTGITYPKPYTGVSPEVYPGLPDIPQYVEYGTSLDYRLSIGYLLFPRTYQSYSQTNINIYTEFTGKYYGAAQVQIFNGMPNAYWLDNIRYPSALKRNAYLDISPGIQAIIHSNLRIDFATTFPFLGISYAKLYPLFTLGLQYYIFL